jgi:hypothetical protein
MSKLRTITGVFKTLFWVTKEEWSELDHKILRLIFGAVSFVAMALFWFYFLRNVFPHVF